MGLNEGSVATDSVVGAKQDVLQLLVRVGVGSGVFAQRADTVNQREQEL
jgi:hypothetical protein